MENTWKHRYTHKYTHTSYYKAKIPCFVKDEIMINIYLLKKNTLEEIKKKMCEKKWTKHINKRHSW